jgi:hypothetical protein
MKKCELKVLGKHSILWPALHTFSLIDEEFAPFLAILSSRRSANRGRVRALAPERRRKLAEAVAAGFDH